jgi:hypothetical protein
MRHCRLSSISARAARSAILLFSAIGDLFLILCFPVFQRWMG